MTKEDLADKIFVLCGKEGSPIQVKKWLNEKSNIELRTKPLIRLLASAITLLDDNGMIERYETHIGGDWRLSLSKEGRRAFVDHGALSLYLSSVKTAQQKRTKRRSWISTIKIIVPIVSLFVNVLLGIWNLSQKHELKVLRQEKKELQMRLDSLSL